MTQAVNRETYNTLSGGDEHSEKNNKRKRVMQWLFFGWRAADLCWVFIAARGLSLVVVSRGYSSLRCAGFSLRGFSCCGAQALGTRASVVVACGLSSCGLRAVERRLSSCGARA